MKNRRKKPPSRERYDLKNPIVSIRCTGDMRSKLRQLQESTGKNPKGILIAAIETLDPLVDEAYKRGYEDAKKKYLLTIECSVCGEDIYIDSEENKRVVKESMNEFGLRHGECEAMTLKEYYENQGIDLTDKDVLAKLIRGEDI